MGRRRARSDSSAPSSGTMRASWWRGPGLCWSAAPSACGCWGRPARCWSARADGASSATACAWPTPACRRLTAWRTCCWRCAPTRAALPPWPTLRGAGRAGGCAGTYRLRRARRSVARAAQPEAAQHEQRLLAQRPARGQHAELGGRVVDVEEGADAKEELVLELAVEDAVHDDEPVA